MVYLGATAPGAPWSVKSRGLAEGLLLYEESMNSLGIPRREAEDPEMDGWYEVDDRTVDYAEAALEEYRKSTKDLEPGVVLKVVSTKVDDAERPQDAVRPPIRREAGLGDVEGGLKREPSL